MVIVRFSRVWRALLRMGHPQVRWLVWLMTQDELMLSQFQADGGVGALPQNRVECGNCRASSPFSDAASWVIRMRSCSSFTTMTQLRLSRFMIYWASHERRHHRWPVCGLPMYSPAPRS